MSESPGDFMSLSIFISTGRTHACPCTCAGQFFLAPLARMVAQSAQSNILGPRKTYSAMDFGGVKVSPDQRRTPSSTFGGVQEFPDLRRAARSWKTLLSSPKAVPLLRGIERGSQLIGMRYSTLVCQKDRWQKTEEGK